MSETAEELLDQINREAAVEKDAVHHSQLNELVMSTAERLEELLASVPEDRRAIVAVVFLDLLFSRPFAAGPQASGIFARRDVAAPR